MTALIIDLAAIQAIVKDFPDNKYPRLVKSRIAVRKVLGNLGDKEAKYLIHRYQLDLSDKEKAVIG